jgi:hypothetical protein
MTPEELKAKGIDVVWAESGTGDDFQCVHVDDVIEAIRSARAEAYEDAATLVERTNFAGEPLLAKIIAANIRLRAKTVSGWRPSSGE